MTRLDDSELKTLLEALHIAARVTVVFPPLEGSRIYTAIKELWDKFGTEAISRGLTDYAEYYPECEGTHIGSALDTGSDAEEAIDFHDQDRFWHQFTAVVAGLAAEHDLGDEFTNLSRLDQIPVHSKYEQRVEAIIESEGISSLINIKPVTKEA